MSSLERRYRSSTRGLNLESTSTNSKIRWIPAEESRSKFAVLQNQHLLARDTRQKATKVGRVEADAEILAEPACRHVGPKCAFEIGVLFEAKTTVMV